MTLDAMTDGELFAHAAECLWRDRYAVKGGSGGAGPSYEAVQDCWQEAIRRFGRDAASNWWLLVVEEGRQRYRNYLTTGASVTPETKGEGEVKNESQGKGR